MAMGVSMNSNPVAPESEWIHDRCWSEWLWDSSLLTLDP